MLTILQVLQLLDRTKHMKMDNVESVDRLFANLTPSGAYDVIYRVHQLNGTLTIVHDTGEKDGVSIYTLWNRDEKERASKLLSFGFSFQVVALILDKSVEEINQLMYQK